MPSAAAPPSPAAPDHRTLWGLDARGLHDRFWASRAWRVVRWGTTAEREPLAAGAGPFLLLGPDDLAHFEPPSNRTLRRRAVTGVRVPVRAPDDYSESVITTDDDRLAGLRRRYRPTTDERRVVHVTRDADLATQWQRASCPARAARAVRLAGGPLGVVETDAPGRLVDARDADLAEPFILDLLRAWPDVADALTSVTQPSPGVFVHRRATVESGARIIAPAWIGADVRVGATDVLAGPVIRADRGRVVPPPARRLARSTRILPRRTRRANRGRRAFDVAFSLVALALTAPLYPLLIAAIWLEDGRPFFFAHRRQTTGGRTFRCIKFRTMCRDAERMKRALLERNRCDGPQFHIPDDPRLLRVGRWMRRFHLDELPQFVNVLLGDMSLVGPRPSPHEENQYCPAWREARLSVKPGMTGLWQVSRTRAAGEDFQEWIRYDLDYVARATWRLDLWILYRTFTTITGRALSVALTRRRAEPAPTDAAPVVPSAPRPRPTVTAEPKPIPMPTRREHEVREAA